MTKRQAALCPHCKRETYLLSGKEDAHSFGFIGKSEARFYPEDNSIRWSCDCGAQHRLTFAAGLAKSNGAPTVTPRLTTTPPPVPVLPVGRNTR